MDEPEILDTGLPGDHRFLKTQNGLWSFDPKCDVNSHKLFNVLKCSVLKLAQDGADKVIMDRRTLKPSFAACKSPSGVISKNVTSAVSRRVQAQKSVAVNVGFAFFRSLYVRSMLLGILALGFVLSGFIMRHLIENPIQTTEALNFDYTKSSPVAFVPLMSSSRVSSDRAIPYNHKLQLAVSLTVPESEYNHKLGVFQSETQVLNIKMSGHIEGLEPTAYLKVILEQRAEFQNGAGLPQIYAASLVLESELPRSKRFVRKWRRTIFVWTSLVSFLAELMFILAFFRPIIVPRGRPKIGYSTKKFDHSNIIFWQKSS
ncbi:hypothetical protein ACFX2J_007744 [Malus domestica]